MIPSVNGQYKTSSLSISATAANLTENRKLRGRYDSAQVCGADTSAFSLHSQISMGRQFDTTGERSGAGPTASYVLRGTRVKYRQLGDCYWEFFNKRAQ
ncbi:unnamed protein product, partial [Brenthis ino]